MNKKNFIELFSQEKINGYGTPTAAIDQANSCDLLSQDIYTDSKRFIYELLQNADDASSKDEKLVFRIDFQGEYLIVSHKGEAFSESDIRSICSVGDGTKKGDENKTGFKGIGFKSVFAYSEYVIIKSKEYCFKFDKQQSNNWNDNWESKNDWIAKRQAENKDVDIKLPWQIIPIWSELPDELKHLPILNGSDYNVSTIIRYEGIEKLKDSLLDLFSESQIILFLRSKDIKIIINTGEELILEKSIEKDVTILKRNNDILSEWLIKTESFDIPPHIQELIKNNNRYPRKLRDSKRTEISFAIQLEKGKLKATDKEKRLVFTYLPTSINYGFPFLVNANFLTDAGRENIHKDLDWNQWIFEQIPLRYFTWIAELAGKNSKYNKQFLSVIPENLNGYNHELERKFNKGYKEAIETIAFIPNLNGDLLKVSEAVYDQTNISSFISSQTLINYINEVAGKCFLVDSFIPYFHPISTIKRLGIEIFEIKSLDGFFSSEIFSSEHKLIENFSLIRFLFQQSQNEKYDEYKNEWNMRLKSLPFIFDENEKIQKPEDIYFPSIEYSNEFSSEISIIHDVILDEINKNNEVKNWLESLGVKEPTDTNFIEKTIIGQSDFITSDNAINIGRYLFKANKKGLLTNYYSRLRNIKLLTQQGTLKSAQECFLSDLYEPDLRLEKISLLSH